MKRLYALLLAVLMMFSLTACSTANEDSGSVSAPPLVSTTGESLTSSNDNSVDDSSSITSQTASTDASITESSSNTSSSTSESGQLEQSANTSQSSSIPQSSLPPQTQSEPESPKVLVAYFPATNTTKGVASRIADALNADLYEITPAIPYTSADLNYNDSSSRSSIEMNDPNSRPAISGSINNMEKYDIVFIGYPIWWGEAPRILNTFVESYSFSGKTVVPFCTSASSGVGSSARNLEHLSSGGQWLSGTRLNGNASSSDIVRWINDLGLDITA